MNRITALKKCGIVFSGLLFVGMLIIPNAQALNLNDLVKQPPQLYLPSQILPGRTAVFTIKAKPGKEVELILSSQSDGTDVGKSTVEKTGTVPKSGVLEMPIQIPGNPDLLGDRQFVEAIVWSANNKSDVQKAQIIQHTGEIAKQNIVFVGNPPDKGNLLVLPGNSGFTSLFRSLDTLNEVSNDPRKKKLLDDGSINRDRAMDQNLNTQQSTH